MNKPARIASIDIFRALTMLLMIWVNDFWTLDNIPKWLEHASAGEDYLGFSDLIFPWFLFIIGMSIPYAIENRKKKGDTNLQISLHLISRTIALLVMGLFHVNMEVYNHEVTMLSKPVFVIITTAAFFMIWNRYPATASRMKFLFTGLRILGVMVLVGMFFIYAGKGASGSETGFKTHWWGILGLIGWVYLVSAFLYLIFRKSIPAAVILFMAFLSLNIIAESGISYNIFPWQRGQWFVGNGGLHVLSFGGIITTLLLMKLSSLKERKKLYFLIFSFAVISMATGLLLRNYFIISKIGGTPPWILISLSTALLLFLILHQVVDVMGKAHWFTIIRPAGVATLTCYLVPYFYYSIRSLMGIELQGFLTMGIPGLTKSLVFAFIIVGITWILGKAKIQLKI